MIAIAVALCLSAEPAPAPAKPSAPKPQLLVLDVVPAEEGDAALAQTLSAAVVSEVSARGYFEIVATRMGQHAETEVREAEDVETGILEAVEDFGADLLILGSSVRAGTTHLHLGPRVEYLTRLAPCPVVILNS